MIEPPIRPRPGQSVVSLSSTRRRMQRTLGIQLARKRLKALGLSRVVRTKTNTLQQRQSEEEEEIVESMPIRETSDNGSNETLQPSLLFRPGQQDDTSTPDNNNNGNGNGGNGAIEDYLFSTPTSYCNIAFLTDDVVIASNARCQIDAVRLPRDHHHSIPINCSNSDDNDVDNNDYYHKKHRRRGRLLSERMGPPSTAERQSFLKLKGLRNGNAFVAGLPSGEIRIFATEREWTWNTSSFQTPKSSLSSSRCHPPPTSSAFLQLILRLAGPRRKYARNDTNPRMNLYQLHLDQNVVSSAPPPRLELFEIPSWDAGPYPPELSTCQNYGPCTDALWDFREVGSSLLAAHVDPQKDCFSICVVDNQVRYVDPDERRGSSSHSSTSFHSFSPFWRKGDAKPILCLDKMTLDNGVDRHEDITAICFVGDYGIAAATCLRNGPRKSRMMRTHSADTVRNFVQFWDRRFVPRSSLGRGVKRHFPSGRDWEEPHGSVVDVIRLASFPMDDAVIVPEANSRVCVAGTSVVGEQWTSKLDSLGDVGCGVSLDGRHSLSVVGLSTPSGDHSSTMCISLQGSGQLKGDETMCKYMEELFIDVTDKSISKAIRLCSDLMVDDDGRRTPTAMSADLDFVAKYVPGCTMDNGIRVSGGDGCDSTQETVLLFDLSKQGQSKNTIQSEDRRKDSRKRNRDGPELEAWNAHVVESDSALPFQLLDEYGLQSYLTCLAFNDEGSVLVCGSADGDLFLW